MKKHLYKCILLGSAWGIIEATFGFCLHKLTLGIGWFFWFPIAFFFINTCYQWTKSRTAVMITAVLAASLKLIDLFFTKRYDVVFNPAISIIIEALSVVMVYSYLEKRQKNHSDILAVVCIGFLWRILYLCYVLFLPAELIQISAMAGMVSFAKFMFKENIINTIVIFLYMYALANYKGKVFHNAYNKLRTISAENRILKPSFSVLALCLAIVVQILL